MNFDPEYLGRILYNVTADLTRTLENHRDGLAALSRTERRERIATAALQGLMSRECDIRFQSLDYAAQEAVFQADALIAALDAGPGKEEGGK